MSFTLVIVLTDVICGIYFKSFDNFSVTQPIVVLPTKNQLCIT